MIRARYRGFVLRLISWLLFLGEGDCSVAASQAASARRGHRKYREPARGHHMLGQYEAGVGSTPRKGRRVGAAQVRSLFIATMPQA